MEQTMKINIAIFVSGSGTNCENLIRYFADSERVCCALVVSNKPDAFALVRAQNLGVATAVAPKAQLNDPDFMNLFTSQGQKKTETSSGSATVNTKDGEQ